MIMSASDERAGRALRRRAALGAALGVAAVIVLIAGVVLILRWSAGPNDGVVAGPPVPAATGFVDPAPKGWRTEQHRGVTVAVPADWGYEFEPSGDWCVADRDGRTPWAEPYVSLGLKPIEMAIACPDLPDRLDTEHVQIAEVQGARAGEQRVNGLWVVTGIVDGNQVKAVHHDRATARRIVGSAEIAGKDAPCRPTLPAALDARPAPVIDLATIEVTGPGMVCQYDPPDEAAQVARLRARNPVSGTALREVAAGMTGAPAGRADCARTVVGPMTELLLTVRIPTGAGLRDLYVRAGSCGDEPGTSFGGFDDGRIVHRLTRSTCQAVLTGPVALMSGSGDVAAACLPS